MKKVALVLGGVSLGLLAAACSGGDEPAPFAEAPPTLVDALQERTGARWIADADPLTGRPYLYVALDDGRPVLSSGSAPSEVPGFVAALGRGLDLDDSFVDSLDAPEELTAASADTNATFRFTQHVPGTKIPVLSGGLVVGARDNGSLAFLQPTIVKGLRALDVNPTLSVEDTNRIIAKLAGHTPAADTAPPTLGVVALDPEHPKLVYRAFVTSDDGTPARVDIDAKTGAIIEIRTEAAAAMAYAAAADYPERDPRRKPDALAPVEVAIGNSNADTEGSAEDVPMRMIASSKTARIAIYDAAGIPFDEDHIDRSFPTQKNTTIAKCRFDSGGKNLHCDETGTNSYSAVDVQNNLVAAANWYWELGGRQWPRAAKEIPIFNHWGKGGEAFYHYGTNSIYIGDPKRVSTSNDAAPLVAYSAGTALDFMAHEYGHGIISRVTGTNGTHLDFENEAGALNEGLADVFAANAKASTGKSYGKATTFTFAEEVRPDHKAIRNFLHPTLGTEAGIAHFSQFKKLAANVAPVKKNDYGFVHANSTVVSQAWALMAWGGFNDVAPHLGVTAEVGFDRALRLFWNTLSSLTSADHSIKGFADKMITYQVGQVKAHPTQTDLSPYWIKHSIVCAWTAVGVIPPLEALAHHGVTCPSPLTTVQTCAGKIAGTYCDPDPRSGFASFSCSGKTVSTSSGAQCPTGKYCHRTLGSVHSPAILDTNGKLQCFDEPQPF